MTKLFTLPLLVCAGVAVSLFQMVEDFSNDLEFSRGLGENAGDELEDIEGLSVGMLVGGRRGRTCLVRLNSSGPGTKRRGISRGTDRVFRVLGRLGAKPWGTRRRRSRYGEMNSSARCVRHSTVLYASAGGEL